MGDDKKLICLLLFLVGGFFFIPSLYAKNKISDVELQSQGSFEEKLVIHTSSMVNLNPELKIEKNLIQVSFPDSTIWPKVEKKLTSPLAKEEVEVLAYQFDPTTVRVRLVFSHNVEDKKAKTYLNMVDGKVELVYPKSNLATQIPSRVVAKKIAPLEEGSEKKNEKSKSVELSPDQLNENYLNQLLGEKPTQGKKLSDSTLEELENQLNQPKELSPKLANTDMKSEIKSGTPDLVATAGKLLGVLLLVLGIFIGLVQVAKKGMFKKAGLSFLNDAKMVNVINTTYLAPKRSLITVKVGEQYLLLAQSEVGINFLTEIKSPASVLKEGERAVTGNNFDDDVEVENLNKNVNPRIRLKEDIQNSSPSTIKEKIVDRVSFTNQVKNKLKELKPLQ